MNLYKKTNFAVISAALLSLCLCIGCGRSDFSPVAEEQIDPAQKTAAERIAYRTLSGWRDGTFEPLSEDFTQEMKQALPSRQQRAAYESISGAFGDFKGLKYAETVASPKTPGLIIYRFRGTFSGGKAQPEIRVVMDSHNKVSGFWCKPWHRVLR